MALINCTECKKEISNTAISCPHCGASIKTEKNTVFSNLDTITIQQTSKKLKIHTIYSILIIIIGFILNIKSQLLGTFAIYIAIVGQVFILIGLFWLIITRLRIWWNHK